jgi:hypothetical protein
MDEVGGSTRTGIREQGLELTRSAACGLNVLFPALFVAIIAEDEGSDAALRVVFEGKTGDAGAVGIKEYGG